MSPQEADFAPIMGLTVSGQAAQRVSFTEQLHIRFYIH
jgi:hypothetical protein